MKSLIIIYTLALIAAITCVVYVNNCINADINAHKNQGKVL